MDAEHLEQADIVVESPAGHPHVALVRVNRPERGNSLTLAMRRQLRQIWIDLRDDDDVWAIVVTGTGDRFFCSGLDLHELARDREPPAKSAAQRHAEMDLLQNDPLSLGLWKPIVGAINGYCLAGGWYLAQMCDVRIAETHAMFGIPETRWAHPASFTWMLPRSVPLNFALEAVLWGDRQYSAQRMYEVGFLNEVVPAGEGLPRALEWADQVCRMGPIAVRMHKELLYRAAYPDAAALRGLAEAVAYRLHTTSESEEGLRAFTDRREPRFEGG